METIKQFSRFLLAACHFVALFFFALALVAFLFAFGWIGLVIDLFLLWLVSMVVGILKS